MKSSGKDEAVLVIAFTLAAMVPIAAFFTVPMYVAMFAAFPELWPTRTRALFSYYELTALFPVLVLVLWYLLRSKEQRTAIVLALSVVGFVALGSLGWWALAPPELMLEAMGRSRTGGWP